MKNLFVHFLSVLALLASAVAGRAAMTLADVQTVIAQAATRAAVISTNSVIAVVDGEGFVLGVWSLAGTNPPALDVLDAITKAGTAAFLSSDQNAFTSRTAGYIVQQHFPPGIRNKPPGPLVGVNFSNLSISDVSRFKHPLPFDPSSFGGGGTNGAPVAPLSLAAISGLAGSPGGVPLYREGHLIGGVGVAGTTRCTGAIPPCIPSVNDIQVAQKRDTDEDVALAGQKGFAPPTRILGSQVFIDGIRVPYVQSTTRLGVVMPLGAAGTLPTGYMLTNSPPVAYPGTNFGWLVGEVRAPIIADPLPGSIDSQPRLTSSEVTSILTLAAQRARRTRAGIRLPRGQPAQVFISVVNNPDAPGVAPTVLGTFRTPGATMFSWDVSVQKARTAVFFSSRTNLISMGHPIACSARTIGFLAQRYYPPGIDGTSHGVLYGLQEMLSQLPVGITNPLNKVFLTSPPVLDPSLPSGITIFPGGFPLYRNGALVGAIGVSGDGIDQDDLIAAAGSINFLPPQNLRADKYQVRGARLPYAKFPRNPEL